MPLSWLPLISDYTREAEKPVKASAVSAVTYGAVSCWMYIIGMAAAIFTAKSEISQIILQSGLGIAGLIVIVLSTVTTTFLDAYSAGVSGETVIPKVNSRWFSVVVTAVGTMGAMLFSMTDITGFLYFIGSVFAPMIAIQIADFYILKNNSNYKKINLKNIVIWFAGFIIYRLLMNVDIVLGRTLLDVVITIIICVAVAYMGKIKLRKV